MVRRLEFVSLFLIAITAVEGADTRPPIWIIIHMANSKDAAEWGASVGANGIEADLRFDGAGNPTEFRHGGICDCTCTFSGVCNHLGSPPCESSVAPDILLKTIAAPNPPGQPGYGLVVIDSKVTKDTKPAAGTNVIKLLDASLFANGYKGVVIVSAPTLDTVGSPTAPRYLWAAATAAAKSPNGSKIYFTVDGEGTAVLATLEKLTTLPSPRIVYGTGISACGPKQYGQQIRLAAGNRDAGVIGFVYIWTIDDLDNADKYVCFGANGVMTNQPENMVARFKQLGYTRAAPGTTFPSATSKKVTKVPGEICITTPAASPPR